MRDDRNRTPASTTSSNAVVAFRDYVRATFGGIPVLVSAELAERIRQAEVDRGPTR